MRVDGRLVLGEPAVAYHLSDEGMVLAHLLELSVAKKVRAAVADVYEVPRVTLEYDRREGRAHARVSNVLAGTCVHGGIGRLGRFQKREALADVRLQSIGSDATGYLAGLSSTHPVANGEQRRRHDESVLVRLAVKAYVAERGASGDESHRPVTPRSGRSSRRCAPGCPA